jgi:hypothetical protein
MNASPILGRLGLVLGLVTLSAAGLATRASAADVVAISGSDGTTSPAWTDIQNDTYDQRAHFASGVSQLSARLNEEIRQLKAKRAGMTTDLKDWDFAMKDVLDSRDLFTSRAMELSKTTTPEAWSDAKDKVGEAWKRSQLAVDKMNTTITS